MEPPENPVRFKPPADRVRSVLAHDHGLDRLDAHLKSAQFGEEALQRLSRQRWHISIVGTLQQIDQVSDAVPTRRRDDAKLAKMTADRVYQHGSLPHQQVACSMVQKCGLLMRRLHRYETHSRPADRLADRLGICSIGLAAANIGFDV